MDAHAKKMAVFHQLSLEAAPQSLQSLLHKLGEGFAERSVRRWLGELIQEGLVLRQGLKRATTYQMKPVGIKTGEDIFSLESAEVVKRIKRSIYEREPVSYARLWIEAYHPNETFYLPSSLRTELFTMGQRVRKEDPAGTYAHQIYHRLLIDLSYNSSRLEGNTYSLLDTQRLLLEGTTAEGKLDEEKIMILNHKEAIRYLVDNASKIEVNEQCVCTLHYLLADGLVERRYAGKIRDHYVRIGGSTYIPYEDPKLLQQGLLKVLEKAGQIKDPFEQSLFLLIHISYLQAFTDVNKRTARLSANIPFIKHNLVPQSFNDINREEYTSALIAVYELQDVRPMVDLYTFSYKRTCAAYDSTVKALGFDEVRVRYRQQRRALIREIILQKKRSEEIKAYAALKSTGVVSPLDQEAFLQDLVEDLDELDVNCLGGFGVMPEEFVAWRQSNGFDNG